MRAGLVVLLAVVATAGAACSSGSGRSVGAFCKRMEAMRAQNGDFDITSAANATAALDHSISQMETAADEAPTDIRADAEQVVNSLKTIKSGDTAAMQRDLPQFEQTTNNLANYVSARCGIKIATTTTTK
jgi:hypothetical protein